MNVDKIVELFEAERLVIISVGVQVFGTALERQGVEVVQVDWHPPAGGDKEMEDILALLGGL